jgi:hypothetical protein
LEGTGSTAPKLRLTVTIRRRSDSGDQEIGVLTRSFDDPRDTDRQQTIVFAVDYQQYWASYFTLPFIVVDVSARAGLNLGVAQNRALVVDVPGEYSATVDLFDETTQSRTRTEFKFSVLPLPNVSQIRR